MSNPLMDKLGISMEKAFNISQKIGNVGSWLYLMDTQEYAWSDEMYQIYEVPRDTRLTNDLYMSLIHREDSTLAAKNFLSILENGVYTSVHRIFVNGKVKWVEDRGRLYTSKDKTYKYVIGMLHDVTWMKEQQIVLDRRWFEFNVITKYLASTTNTNELRSIITSVDSTIREVMDVGLTILFVNYEGICEKVSSDDDTFPKLLLDQDDDQYMAYRAMMTGQRIEMDIDAYPNLQSRKQLKQFGVRSIISFPIVHDGNVIGSLSIAAKRQKIYENEVWFLETICGYLSAQVKNAVYYHKLKDELEQRIRAEEKNEELQKSVEIEKLRSEIFTNVSHEFKTPINVILSTLELVRAKLEKTVLPCAQVEEYKRFAGYVEQNAYRLLNLTTNLLDSTKLHHGFAEAFFDLHDINQVVSVVADSVQPYVQEKQIKLLCRFALSGDSNLVCDRVKVERILLNLLSNSIKNTPVNGKIEMSVSEDADYFYISVKDNGVGIPEEILPVVFDKFKVGAPGFTKQSEGSGIGLSIVKELVKMHGGTIEAKSIPNLGTEFRFSISKHLEQNVKESNQLSDRISINQTRVKMEFSDMGS